MYDRPEGLFLAQRRPKGESPVSESLIYQAFAAIFGDSEEFLA